MSTFNQSDELSSTGVHFSTSPSGVHHAASSTTTIHSAINHHDKRHTHETVRWDEATIAEHDKERGTRQKVRSLV
jgi:hypothetical protein